MNPMEQSHPPDKPISHFIITADRVMTAKGGDVWYVTCPQWNYKNETNERIVEHITNVVKAIHSHNEAQKLT